MVDDFAIHLQSTEEIAAKLGPEHLLEEVCFINLDLRKKMLDFLYLQRDHD